MSDKIDNAAKSIKETVDNARDAAHEAEHRTKAEIEEKQADIDRAKRDARIKNAEQ